MKNQEFVEPRFRDIIHDSKSRTPESGILGALLKGRWGSGAQQCTDQGLTIPVQVDPVIRAFGTGEYTAGEVE